MVPAVLLIGLMVCTYSWAKDTDVVPITKTTTYARQADGKPVQSEADTVLMPHKKHQEKGVACIACHHKMANDEREKVCAVCHIGEEGQNTMHTFCIGCHTEKKVNAVDCEQCHKSN